MTTSSLITSQVQLEASKTEEHSQNTLGSLNELKSLEITATGGNRYDKPSSCTCTSLCKKRTCCESCRWRGWEIRINLECKVAVIEIVSKEKGKTIIHNSLKVTQSYLRNHPSFENIIESPADIWSYWDCFEERFSFENDILTFRYEYFISSCQSKPKEKTIVILIPRYSADLSSVETNITNIEVNITNLNTTITKVNAQISDYNTQILMINQEIDDLKKKCKDGGGSFDEKFLEIKQKIKAQI